MPSVSQDEWAVPRALVSTILFGRLKLIPERDQIHQVSLFLWSSMLFFVDTGPFDSICSSGGTWHLASSLDDCGCLWRMDDLPQLLWRICRITATAATNLRDVWGLVSPKPLQRRPCEGQWHMIAYRCIYLMDFNGMYRLWQHDISKIKCEHLVKCQGTGLSRSSCSISKTVCLSTWKIWKSNATFSKHQSQALQKLSLLPLAVAFIARICVSNHQRSWFGQNGQILVDPCCVDCHTSGYTSWPARSLLTWRDCETCSGSRFRNSNEALTKLRLAEA